MRAIPERLRDASCGAAIQIYYLYLFLIYQLIVFPYYTQLRNSSGKWGGGVGSCLSSLFSGIIPRSHVPERPSKEEIYGLLIGECAFCHH